MQMSEPFERAPKEPLCPSCRKPMTLVRVTPRLGGLAELRTFACEPCVVVVTEAAPGNE
jgi:hypothetical protein